MEDLRVIDYDTWIDYFRPVIIYPALVSDLKDGGIFMTDCTSNREIIESTKPQYVWTLINDMEIVQGYIPNGLKYAITDRPWYTTVNIKVTLGGIQ